MILLFHPTESQRHGEEAEEAQSCPGPCAGMALACGCFLVITVETMTPRTPSSSCCLLCSCRMLSVQGSLSIFPRDFRTCFQHHMAHVKSLVPSGTRRKAGCNSLTVWWSPSLPPELLGPSWGASEEGAAISEVSSKGQGKNSLTLTQSAVINISPEPVGQMGKSSKPMLRGTTPWKWLLVAQFVQH